jgi:hypothetical protein
MSSKFPLVAAWTAYSPLETELTWKPQRSSIVPQIL